VFFFLAARKPLAYVSFLSFTMWAYLFHGLLMAVQALTHMSTQWHRFLMDIHVRAHPSPRHLCLATCSERGRLKCKPY
jgi:hypothetical protein